MDHLVCTTCLVGLVNDDWTAIEDNHSAVATAEALGMVTLWFPPNRGGFPRRLPVRSPRRSRS